MRLLAGALIAAFTFITCLGNVNCQLVENDAEREKDEALLEQYRSGQKQVGNSFYSIHENPVAGQGATYLDDEANEHTYRVAFVRGNVCTVEKQLPGSKVVIAVEFELDGAIKNSVRRAWVGRKGEKPLVAPVQHRARYGGAVGLGGNSEVSRTKFTDREEGGLKWSGTLFTRRYWGDRDRNGDPVEITRTWISTEDWFNRSLRKEVEENGSVTCVWQMETASEDFPALLDWSEVPVPTPEKEEEIRKPVLEAKGRYDVQRMVAGNLQFGNHWGLHPDAKVGDWAEYGFRRLTLAKLEQGRGVVECTYTNDELKRVEAIEFEVEDGQAISVVARYAGIAGDRPVPAKYSRWGDGRPLEVEEGEIKPVEFAGRTWQARLVTEIRSSLRPEIESDYKDITELTICDNAPFARPLKTKEYRKGKEDEARVSSLTAMGVGRKPDLDWLEWTPSAKWEAPFTAQQVKDFIKVGMRWRYSQEFDRGDEGKEVTYQDWKVTEVNETGYKLEIELTAADGTKTTLHDTASWSKYIDRIRSFPRGTVKKEKLKVGETEIDVVLYSTEVMGKKGVLGLSPDLPGIRISTEEKLIWPSKVMLEEFHYPEDPGDQESSEEDE